MDLEQLFSTKALMIILSQIIFAVGYGALEGVQHSQYSTYLPLTKNLTQVMVTRRVSKHRLGPSEGSNHPQRTLRFETKMSML